MKFVEKNAQEKGEETKQDMKLHILLSRIFSVTCLVLLTIFVVGIFVLPTDDIYRGDDCHPYQETWINTMVDGSADIGVAPYHFYAKSGEWITLYTKIPKEVADSGYLCIRSARQKMVISVDGAIRTVYDTDESRIIGAYDPVYYVFVPVDERDAGKTLCLEMMSKSDYAGELTQVYYGTEIGIWRKLVNQRILELITSFVMVVVGALSLIIFVILCLIYHKFFPITYISEAVLLMAMWSLSQSPLRQLICENDSWIADFSFICMMLIPIPLVLYINSVQKQRYKELHLGCVTLSLADLFLTIGLHMAQLVDYSKSVISAFACIFACIACMVVTCYMDYRKHRIREYISIVWGFVAVSISAVITIILFLLRIINVDAGIISIGMIFLFCFAAVSAVREVMNINRKRLEAEHASHMKEEFLASMSHEIRTPLNSILGFNHMILEESKEPTIIDYAKDVEISGKVLHSLIDDVLDFSKIESGHLELTKRPYNPLQLVEDCFQVVHKPAKDKGLQVRVNNDRTIPLSLEGDDNRIRQIMINLLTNSVKYTEQGEIELTLHWDKLDNGLALLHMEVRDTGIGIAKEEQEEVFLSFKRGGDVAHQKIEGTGLGLSITYTLVHAMGGEIHLQSEVGYGTTFFVDLPQKILDERPAGTFEDYLKKCGDEYLSYAPVEEKTKYTDEEIMNYTAPGKRALIVDDNEMNLKVTAALLRSTQMTLDCVTSGEEALDKVQQEQYDIIFLDHMMPGMDGIETFQNMRGYDALNDVPIIMVTGNAVAGMREQYLSLGFDDYVAKPLVKKDLLRLLAEYLKV
ncbi:MAG: response regulator [Lachnospiraceae bacterium]|nr:response regulator [Lachnospiraceae bacterium]